MGEGGGEVLDSFDLRLKGADPLTAYIISKEIYFTLLEFTLVDGDGQPGVGQAFEDFLDLGFMAGGVGIQEQVVEIAEDALHALQDTVHDPLKGLS